MGLKFNIILSLLLIPPTLLAQSRTNVLDVADGTRGIPELTVCSQNLENFGFLNDVKSRNRKINAERLQEKEIAIVRRIARVKCDVVAVQEVLGKTEEIAKNALKKLSLRLKRHTNRDFEVKVGASNDKKARLGYLIATDRAKVLGMLSYHKIELPKTAPKQKPRLFARGPLELQLRVKGHERRFSKVINLINFHFKSKHSAQEDPAQLEWETYRMEMAEALRRIVVNRHERSFTTGDSILIVLGDRNSHFDVASAKILEGVLNLNHFKGDAPCRLSKRGVPLCQPETAKLQILFSALTTDPQSKSVPGTYRYGKVFSWLDDILMPAESLLFARVHPAVEGDYDTGVLYDYSEASDHDMVYVRLNW